MPTQAELEGRIAELEAAQERANTFFEVSRDLTKAKNEADLLRVVAQPALNAGADKAALLYFDVDGQQQPEWAEIVASIDNSTADVTDFPIGTRLHLPEFPFTNLFVTQPHDPLLIADIATDPRLSDSERALLTDTNTSAWVVIPLMHSGRWLGTIQFVWSQPHPFSETEMAFYQTLVSLAVPVVENRRLLNKSERIISGRVTDLRRKLTEHPSEPERQLYQAELLEYQQHLEALVYGRTHRLEALANFSRKVSETYDLDELLRLLVNQTKENFGYYHVHVYVRETMRAAHQPEQEVLIVRAGVGVAGETLLAERHQIPLDTTNSLVARAAREQRILIIDDVSQEPTWLPNKLLPDTQSEIAVPIILEGKSVGVLDVQSDKVGVFDEGDANLLHSLANQVAAAMRNAGLYKHYRQRAETLQHEIKERKIVEEALRQNESRYRLIAENVTDLISQVSLDGVYKYVSVSCRAMLGYEQSELVGQTFDQFIHTDDLTQMAQIDTQADELTDVRTRTYRLQHKDGHYVWVEATSRMIRDSETGQPVEFISVTRDITARRQANEELQTFKTLVENATEGIYVTDLDGHIIYTNPSFLSSLGYETLLGQQAATLISEEYLNNFEQGAERALSGKAWRGYLPHKHSEGHVVPMESSACGIVDEQKQISSLAFITHDITEREEAAKALMSSEKKFYSLYVSMNEALALYEMVYDDEGKPLDYKFKDINPMFEDLMGLKWENVVGRNATEVFETERVPYLSTYNWVATSGETTSFEVTLFPINKVCRVSVFSPTIGQFATVIQDISQRRLMEQRISNYNRILEEEVAERTRNLTQALEDLQSTQAQLVEAEKMAALGSLVAGVAHEINTPVGIGVSMASLLSHETDKIIGMVKGGKMKISALNEYLQTADESSRLILNNLNRAAELVQSFKRVAIDQTNLERRSFQVKPYIQETLLSIKHVLKRTKHTLEVEGDDSISLDSFPGAFSQIVSNLVLNSVKHAYEDDEQGHIRFDVSQAGETVTLIYQDDGIGIPPENLQRIFEPFFTTARSTGGSGLGLHIVYNLVTQSLSGTIHCESQVGLGTKFILKLPTVANEANGHSQNESSTHERTRIAPPTES